MGNKFSLRQHLLKDKEYFAFISFLFIFSKFLIDFFMIFWQVIYKISEIHFRKIYLRLKLNNNIL